MKDVLKFNLQRFAVYVGNDPNSSYTSLTDAFTAQSGTTGALTFTFLGDDSSTGLKLDGKTYTFNLNGNKFTGDVDLTNASLTIGTETNSAFTFSGIYKLHSMSLTTPAVLKIKLLRAAISRATLNLIILYCKV